MRIIVFDWDGTLVDTIGHLYAANAAVMAHFGLPFDRAIFRRHFAPDWRVMYERLGIPADRVEEAGTVWEEAYHGADAPLFPGVAEALAALRDAGYRLGLVTGGYRDRVTSQLDRHGLVDVLEERVYGDDPLPPKPHPAALTEVMRRLGLERADAAVRYVGDALDDMRMARAAGVTGVGIVSMVGDRTDLEAAGAAETAESVVTWVERHLAA